MNQERGEAAGAQEPQESLVSLEKRSEWCTVFDLSNLITVKTKADFMVSLCSLIWTMQTSKQF